MGIQNQGTIAFRLNHEKPDWWSDTNGYDFGTVDDQSGIAVTARKHPDGMVEVDILGALGGTFHFRHPTPQCGKAGLHVAITWQERAVKLYLNGVAVETQYVAHER